MTMTKRAHNAGSDKEDTSHTGNGKTCINKTGSDNGVRYKS